MQKILLLASGVVLSIAVAGAACAQGVTSTQTASARSSTFSGAEPVTSAAAAATSPPTLAAPMFTPPPISDQQLSQELGPALGLVVDHAQQLINVGGQGMQTGQAVAQQGAGQSGGQISNPAAGASSQAGLQSGLSQGLGLLSAPHL